MKSIIQTEKECFICGGQSWLEEHHIFEGVNRKLSERFGLKVWLCHYDHNEPPRGVHHNKKRMLELKKIGQKAFMQYYGTSIEDFRQIFGKSYL